MKVPALPRRVLTWGLAWGLAISLVEPLSMLDIDLLDSPQRLLWMLAYWAAPLWCLIGCLFTWAADRGERVAGTRGVVVAWLLVSLCGALAQPAASIVLSDLARNFLPVDRFSAEVGVPRLDWSPNALLGSWLLNLWTCLLYGGLLMAGYALTRRSERIHTLLHETAMARSRTEELLDMARLEALERQIDPALLLNAMQELECHYRADPDRADRLLEALVEFLRCAMRGLRERVSTLHSELRLAQAYALLQQERGVGGTWRIGAEAVPYADSSPFPSLLMLRLLALGGESGHPALTVYTDGDCIDLALSGLTRAPPTELRQSLSAQLRALYGERFQIASALPAGVLVIRLGNAHATA